MNNPIYNRTKVVIDKRLEQLFEDLGEHVDAIQVLITWVDPEKNHTITHNNGIGNWNSRINMARTFVLRDDIETDADERAKFKEENL